VLASLVREAAPVDITTANPYTSPAPPVIATTWVTCHSELNTTMLLPYNGISVNNLTETECSVILSNGSVRNDTIMPVDTCLALCADCFSGTIRNSGNGHTDAVPTAPPAPSATVALITLSTVPTSSRHHQQQWRWSHCPLCRRPPSGPNDLARWPWGGVGWQVRLRAE